VDDNHAGLAGHGDEHDEDEDEEDEDNEGECEQPLGREETLSKDSAIDNRYDSDEVSPTGIPNTVHCF
jgi:hypothetical protein